ncbi:IS110 family transposase [Streptomyces sp. NPDC018338]|uniref:IS110 family transposase n=1 Tax=Streptomyces sp. NPDC018338 TaxID=3157192 RepID=UPI0033CF2FFE
MNRIWAGIDSGKTHHHCVAIDQDGTKRLSRRVPNGEPELLHLLQDVLALGDHVTWAVDMAGGEPALLLALLAGHDQELLYIPGRVVNRASDGYRGEGKTDARDALVIADQARIRRDLKPMRPADEATIELKILTNRRTDLVRDRTRAINRLRSTLTGMFPALERALVLTSTGPLVLLDGYQTPASIRRIGTTRLTRWLRARGVRSPEELATTAVEAAEQQHTAVPGEAVIAQLVWTLAADVRVLNEKVAEVDQVIEDRFRAHDLAEIITSMPGIGPLLGAEFLAGVGSDLTFFGTPDRLAAFAGLAPAPHDSGKKSGNLHRPRHYHRGLQRVFYMSALTSVRYDPNSRTFYARKRAEGKRHTQAVIALARRRVNVLWALIRDRRLYEVVPPGVTASP